MCKYPGYRTMSGAERRNARMHRIFDEARRLEAEKLPKFYRCGICECFHPLQWDGDCRDDANRFAMDELDAAHGPNGWEEVPMPGMDDGTNGQDRER